MIRIGERIHAIVICATKGVYREGRSGKLSGRSVGHGLGRIPERTSAREVATGRAGDWQLA